MIPENIKQLANKVRNEIYGRDVRESIAQSMEVSGETSNEANERSKDTAGRQTDVENRFDDQIAGNTDIDEVIDARRPEGGESYPTLRKRLDDEHKEVTAQLAQTVKTQVICLKENETYINNSFKRAKTLLINGGSIFIPKGEYEVDPNEEIVIPDNIAVFGEGQGNTIIQSNQRRTREIFNLQGNNILIRDLTVDLHEYDETSNLTEISCIEINESSSNIHLERLELKNGYSGVWLNPKQNAEIDNVKITNSNLHHLRHHVYIGYTKVDLSERTDSIKNVVISNNHITEGLFDGDGIKTTSRCKNIVIKGNVITGHERDAIDLYASGDTITISDNILMNNNDKGIDIKNGYMVEHFGISGNNNNITISNNIIKNNYSYGIGIANGSEHVGNVYQVSIRGNILNENSSGIRVDGSNINLQGNLIYKNRENGILLQTSQLNERTNNIIINSNNILNNGGEATSSGIRLSSNIDDVIISNNTITNSNEYENSDKQLVGLFVGDFTNNIKVSKNVIKGHLDDVITHYNANIIGETIDIPIPNITSSSGVMFNEIPYFSNSKTYITSAEVLLSDSINNVDTDQPHILFTINKKSKNSTENIVIRGNNTIPFTKFVPTRLLVLSNNALNKNEAIEVEIQGVNGGVAIPRGNIKLNIIEH